MLEHEFYADPTVFDHWQNSTENWLGSGLEKLSPFSWALGFCSFASAFLLVAAGVFIDSLQHNGQGETLVLWNQALAQGVTIMLALTASTTLFGQARKAWPSHISIADGLRSLTSLRSRPETLPGGVGGASSQRPANLVTDRQAVQEFFAGVRAAGVNVTIAKALFTAGVRTSQHLNRIGDSELYAIHGVGPATVRKLRAHFSQHDQPPARPPC